MYWTFIFRKAIFFIAAAVKTSNLMQMYAFFAHRTSWKRVINFTGQPLYMRCNGLPYPLERKVGWSQGRSGTRGNANILDPTGTQTPNPLSASQ
jgi:hypothetical protein